MTDREQAIKDVAEAIDDGEDFVSGYAEDYDDEDEYGRAVNYAVSQRERVIQLERDNAAKDAAIDTMRDALHRLHDWCEAYPLEVFPEPNLEVDRKLLGDYEFTRLNAYSMRHVVTGISGIVNAALESK